MKSEVSVTFKDAAPLRINLEKAEPMTPEAARAWLDEQFTELGCEPLRPTGKVLNADKVLVVAEAAGPSRFADAAWAQQFGRSASAALGKPVVRVDVPDSTVGY
ncbi:hypothetical protein GCM10028796_21650 [Ramlibacter monticola]|uniref:Uncharacterized protein n=1 Tax=Ramlibacter monticola TaxID=1926872 RepID=A0A937CTK8_9BURK|nr:hypothetical protein [Ramlibacter monticola]MBL0392416.1 hypothetical protein [Ramlibacter monticola]